MKGDLKKNDNKHQISFKLTRYELNRALSDLRTKLFNNKLVIDGEQAIIPRNAEIDYKVKYEDENKYVLSIKIEWAKEAESSHSKECEDD
jgi:hypothetical protein